MIKISSFKVFGIKIDNKQTLPIYCDIKELEFNVNTLIDNTTIHKVVIIKRWV